MEKNTQEHFAKFYRRFLFIDQNTGVEEKTYEDGVYFDTSVDDGKINLYTVYEQTLKDSNVYFKVPGIILKLTYGEWYNKKYGELHLYIYPDVDYDGTPAHIKDVLDLLNDFLANNFKEYNEKINKVIYGSDNTEAKKVKYRKKNIFAKDNVRNIHINGVEITDEDIKSLGEYKRLFFMDTKNCNYRTNSLSDLRVQGLSDYNSKMPSINIFNNFSSAFMILSNTEFLSKEIKPLTLRTTNLSMNKVDLPYENLFVLTNFINLLDFKLNGILLKPMEIEFLRAFHNAEEMEVYGEANTLKFLEDLPLLKNFSGFISIVDLKYLKQLKQRYQEQLKKMDYLKESDYDTYVANKTKWVIQEQKKLLANLLVSKVALVKWDGIINNSTVEDVQKRLKMYANMPIELRQKLGTEKDIEFVQTDISKAYKLLGIDLIEEDKDLERGFKTSIIGPYGKTLYKESTTIFGKEVPVIGPNGKMIAKISYREERDRVIPEHYESKKEILVTSEDNIFDYFYNHHLSEEQHIKHLKGLLEHHPILTKNDNYLEYLEELNNLTKELYDLEHADFEDLFTFLSYTAFSDYREVETTFRGKKATTYEEIKDPYLIDGLYENLYGVLKRHRKVESIIRMLNKIFKDDGIKKAQQEEVLRRIEELLVNWKKIDEIRPKIRKYSDIIEINLDIKYKDIIDELNLCDYIFWYINDIDLFLEKFNLNEEEREFFQNFILLKQSEKLDDITNTRNELCDEAESIWDRVSGEESYCFDMCGNESLEEALEDGNLTQENYDLIKYHDNLEKEAKRLLNILERDKTVRENEYIKMMDKIDALTTEDLKEIKAHMFITEEMTDSFDKFADYLYYYIYHDYPYWIKTELLKTPNLPEAYSSSIRRTLKEEVKYHDYGYSKVVTNPF